jgi:hypothetical protein
MSRTSSSTVQTSAQVVSSSSEKVRDFVTNLAQLPLDPATHTVHCLQHLPSLLQAPPLAQEVSQLLVSLE